MKIYADGSCIGLQKGDPYIGWGSVCNLGVIACGSQKGGTNVNAEMFAIESCLKTLYAYKYRLLKDENEIEIITDSKVSLQILEGMKKNPDLYDLNESVNYLSAHKILKFIKDIKEKFNVDVKFTHIRGHRDSLGNNFADYVATTESMKLKMSEECK